MVEKYAKKVSSAAIASRVIVIDGKVRQMFPPSGQRFVIRVNDTEISAKIDKISRIYLSTKIFEILKIKSNDILIFTKLDEGTFSVSKTDARAQ